MAIQRLEVRGLRNLRYVRLEACGRINIISGPNGSGKTSLLEAIHMLGLGRSFRGIKTAPLIHHEMERLTVYGEIMGADGQQRTLGILKGRRGEQQIRIDREPVNALVELAQQLPLQILNSDSFSLVDGGAKVRRQFMDWGVFHVKPLFIELWRRSQRALRQRNSLLRGSTSLRERAHGRIAASQKAVSFAVSGVANKGDFDGFEAWEAELAGSAETLDLLRREYLEAFEPHFLEMLSAFKGLPTISLEYRRGWREDGELLGLLATGRQRDHELGYTQAGPHRATLDVKVNGLPAAEVLSRGQQKLVVAALKLAQGACMAEKAGKQGLYLVDDLPAELDKEHRRVLCQILGRLGAQVFITSVDADVIAGALSEGAWFQEGDVQQFHVEQGEYRCLTK